MTFTYDPSTTTGAIRMLVPGEQVESTAAFTDEELAAILTLSSVGNVVELAAATAMERIAADQLLLLKKVKVDVITVEGDSVSDAFLRLAGRLRGAYESGGSADEDIQIAELVYDDLTYSERLANEELRA